MIKAKSHTGFTLIELAMVIGIIAILASVAVVKFADLAEERDRDAVCSAKASIQTAIVQGSTRMDVAPDIMLGGTTPPLPAGAPTYNARTQSAIRQLLSSNGGNGSGIRLDALGVGAGGIQVTINPGGTNPRRAAFTLTGGSINVASLTPVGPTGWNKYTTATICN